MLGGKNQPMTVGVWNAGVNQTPTLIEAKINQLEGLAEKNLPMTDRVGNAGVNQTGTLIEAKINHQKAWREKPAKD